MERIKIAIADDHNLFREGVRALLEDERDIEIVGEASTGKEIIELVEKTPPHVILMDINMPELSGIEATRYISENYPGVRVLALSMSLEDKHISEMLAAGAKGYILKSTGKSDLVAAINTIYANNSYFDHEVSERIIGQLKRERYQPAPKQAPALSPLTQREIEVLQLIVSEKTNGEIAEELHISIRTVDTHRRSLLQKLKVKNTAGLVRYALKNKLFPS